MRRGGTLEPLNPKQIQARVRAGASAETIAADTGWPLDRVIRYAGPPLAERAYVAERAAAVEIRRDAAGQSTSLSDSVDAALEGMGLYPDEVQWDAWRRSDGKWVVSVTHPGLHEAVAAWTYDHAGRNLHPLDEVARRFMESGFASIEDFLGIEPAQEPEQVEPEQVEPEHAEPEAEQRPRLVAVDGAQSYPGPLNAPERAAPAAPGSGARWTGSPARQPTVALNREPGRRSTVSTQRPTQPPTSATPASATPTSETGPIQAPAPASGNKARPKGKGRRASVPSWDEILFGASKPEDR